MLNNEAVRTIIRNRKDETNDRWDKVAERAGIPLDTLRKYIYRETGAMTLETTARVLDAMGLELAIIEKGTKKKC